MHKKRKNRLTLPFSVLPAFHCLASEHGIGGSKWDPVFVFPRLSCGRAALKQIFKATDVSVLSGAGRQAETAKAPILQSSRMAISGAFCSGYPNLEHERCPT